jgi:hypothetical protein
MARIRTVKPELFRHEELFELEQSTGLPIRVSFIALFTVCDREGRFKWRPRQLKLDCLPYDEIDFSRVLDALMTRGFIQKYKVSGVEYGCIPSFTTHQVINNRESASQLPSIDESDAETDEKAEIPADSGENNGEIEESSRVPDASSTRHDLAQGEKEGKGREKEGEGDYCAEPIDSTPAPKAKIVITLPLNKKGTFHEVTETDVTEYEDLYPAVDVMQEFRNMLGWLKANPTKRKTSSGAPKFINSWLAREQNNPTQKSPMATVNRASGFKQPAQRPDYSNLGNLDDAGSFIDSVATRVYQ